MSTRRLWITAIAGGVMLCTGVALVVLRIPYVGVPLSILGGVLLALVRGETFARANVHWHSRKQRRAGTE